MSEWNNVTSVACKNWLVLPTVYSDALSYGEQLDKFCYNLNKVIENNNILPDYVSDKIKEYISSGEIEEVVRDVIGDFILNVKYPPKGITPAVGDGSTDDGDAFQGCIDYVSKHGGAVYVPYGSYLVHSIQLKSNVAIFGFDRYSTKVVLKGGAEKALLYGENVTGVTITGMTLDGNSGIQVNDVDVVNVSGGDYLFYNLIMKDGYQLLTVNGNTGNMQCYDIVNYNAVNRCYDIAGEFNVTIHDITFNEISKFGTDIIRVASNKGSYAFESKAQCNVGLNLSGSNNVIYCRIDNATTKVNDTGENNTIEVAGYSKKANYSNEIKINTNSIYATCNDCTLVTNNNISTNVTGTISEMSDNKVETVSKEKTLTTDSLNETILQTKHTSTNKIIEEVNTTKNTTISDKYTLNIGSGEISVNANSYPVHFIDKDVDLYNVGDIPTYLYTPTNVNDIGTELNNLLVNYNVSLAPNEYKTTVPIKVPVNRMLFGNNACITGTNLEYVIIIGDDYTIGDRGYNITGVTNLTVNCQHYGSGILINSKGADLDTVKVRNPLISGVDVFSPTISEGKPADARIVKLQVYQDDDGTNSIAQYGVRIYGTDCNFDMVRTLFTKIGFYISKYGASTFFSNCHPLSLYSGHNEWENSYGWKDESGGGTYIVNCYADNFRVAYSQNTATKLFIAGFVYYCWEYTNTLQRTFLELWSGSFVEGVGLEPPMTNLVTKVNYPSGYFYLGNDRVKLSWISPNEPSNFIMSDDGSTALYNSSQEYFREFSNDATAYHLVAVIHTAHDGIQAASTINITADEFSITGLTVSKAGILTYGVGTDTELSVKVTKYQDDDNTNTVFVYVKYESGWFGRCLCHVNNNAKILPRLWNPDTEPTYIIGEHSYKVATQTEQQ